MPNGVINRKGKGNAKKKALGEGPGRGVRGGRRRRRGSESERMRSRGGKLRDAISLGEEREDVMGKE